MPFQKLYTKSLADFIENNLGSFPFGNKTKRDFQYMTAIYGGQNWSYEENS